MWIFFLIVSFFLSSDLGDFSWTICQIYFLGILTNEKNKSKIDKNDKWSFF